VYPGREPWNVWDFTLAEIQRLDGGTWFVETDPFNQIHSGNISPEDLQAYAGLQIPTLRQALEFTRDHHWRVNVELKDQPDSAKGQALVEKTAALATRLGMDSEAQVVISSFNHDYLRQIRQINPHLPIQALVIQRIEEPEAYLRALGAEAINPPSGLWSASEIAKLENQGIQFNIWTVNDEPSMKALVQAKTSGIFTDFPQVLKRLL
jgi:glycerophosphoryl diester phosphodiesterase